MGRRVQLIKVKKKNFFFVLGDISQGYSCNKQFLQLKKTHQEKKVDFLLLCNSLQHNFALTVTSAA